jgi:hypothetical protein
VADEVEDWEDFENLRLEEKDGNIQLIHDPNYAPMEESSEESEREIWKGDPRQLRKDEYLDYENEAYDLFYRSSIDWSVSHLILSQDLNCALAFLILYMLLQAARLRMATTECM